MVLLIDNNNQVKKITKLGLESYSVIFRGVVVGQFMSVPAANTKLLQLLNKAKV